MTTYFITRKVASKRTRLVRYEKIMDLGNMELASLRDEMLLLDDIAQKRKGRLTLWAMVRGKPIIVAESISVGNGGRGAMACAMRYSCENCGRNRTLAFNG